ncbi:MAG: Gfo/Idh/MocA family oxidoreductase [Acidobacteria bacterium]|nr:Gfo/Idh/MocA family oxidoreductase [Acidobacteriota bacterium]
MTQSNGGCSRRQILTGAAAASAAPMLIPSTVLGKQGSAPSNRINLGFIGLGTLGPGHLQTFLKMQEVQVVALCDVDRARLAKAKSTVDAVYAGARTHNDFRELLDRKDVDAVVVTVGDRWNAVMAAMAAKVGKDMYCEKPVSLTIREARAMAETVKRHERVFQTGLQQRSEPQFRKAIEVIHDGRIGNLKIIYPNLPGTNKDVNLPPEPVPEGLDWDLWLGQAPWRPYNSKFHPYGQSHGVTPWAFCRDFAGGSLTNGTVHNFDIVQWGLGMDGSGPVEIIPPGANGAKSLTFRYANGVSAEVVDWKLDDKLHSIPQGWDVNRKFQDFSVLFVGDKGWVYVGREGLLESNPKEVLADWHGLGEAKGWIEHHANFLHAIRTRQRPVAHEDIGAGSTIVAHLGNVAYWTGRAVRWDPVKEEFLGDDEANRMRERAMRAPWSI